MMSNTVEEYMSVYTIDKRYYQAFVQHQREELLSDFEINEDGNIEDYYKYTC